MLSALTSWDSSCTWLYSQCPLCWFLLLANTMPFDLGATFLFSDIFASAWKCIVRRKRMWHLLVFKSCGIPITAGYATWVTLLINRGKQSTSRAVDFGMDLFRKCSMARSRFQSISQWSQHNCQLISSWQVLIVLIFLAFSYDFAHRVNNVLAGKTLRGRMAKLSCLNLKDTHSHDVMTWSYTQEETEPAALCHKEFSRT